MAQQPPALLRIRSLRPFHTRGVVAVLQALADDLARIRSGGTIRLSERVKEVRKTEQTAETWLWVLHIVLQRSGLSAADLEDLARQYRDLMSTRQQPIKSLTRSGPRPAPRSLMFPMEIKEPPARRPMDQG